MKERLVPITKIGDHFPIKVFPLPPYRDRLAIRLEPFTSALRTANILNYPINIRFHPITTTVDLYPYGNWQWVSDMKEIDSQEMVVSVNDMGRLIWKFPYRVSETASAWATARLASRFMREAIGISPIIRPVFGSIIDRFTEQVAPVIFYSFQKPFVRNLVVESDFPVDR